MPHETRPRPIPTERSKDYWRAAAHGRLEIQRCKTCALWNHPPVLSCATCQGTVFGFEAVAGLGTIVQYVVVRQTKFASFAKRVPYGAAAVELDEQAGLVIVGNVLGCTPEAVRIGARVRVDFEQMDDQIGLPQFHLLPEGAGSE